MNSEPLPQNARELWMQGRYDAAARLFEQAIVLAPESMAYWQLGLMHLLQDQVDEAQSVWFAAIVELDPADLDAEVAQLGQILLTEAHRQFDRQAWHLAEWVYTQVLELAPGAAVLVELGRACAYQGELDGAIAAWHSAIELQPDCAIAYTELGKVGQKLGQFPDAIAAYAQAIALEPTWELHHSLGLCLAQEQQWPAATQQLQQALQLQPTYAPLWGDLGQILLQQGDWAGAIAHFRAAVYHATDFAVEYCAWVQQQDPSQPELVANGDWLQSLSQDEPDDSIATKLALAKLLTRSGQPAAAIALYKHIGQVAPDCPQATEELAKLFALIDAAQEIQPLFGLPPRGIFETTEEWGTAQAAGLYHPLTPGSLITLAPPQTIHPEIHFSFRFPRQIPLGGTFVAQIPQGSFWIDPKQSSNAVLTGDRQLLGDLSPEFPLLSPGHPRDLSRHARFRADGPPVQPIDGTIAILAGLGNNMYFHWMFDVLPRLDLLDRSGIGQAAIDGFLVSHHLPFQQETLAQLGIPAAKILTPEQYPHVRATRLLVPSFPGNPAWMPQWVCQWLQRQFLADDLAPTAPTRLYISRRETANRRLINEAAIVTLLESLGFQCVTLESRSVKEQAALLSTAEVVISAHGSGLTNLVFCRPGTIVIEIFPPYFVYPCYWLVSNLVGLKYFYLIGSAAVGESVDRLLYPNPRLADVFVDLGDLQAVLELAKVK